MTKTLGHGRRLAAVGLALGCLASPARAQFMTGAYPVIVVPPPPGQSMVMPKKPKLQPAPQETPPAPPDETSPGLSQNYQGRTRVGR